MILTTHRKNIPSARAGNLKLQSDHVDKFFYICLDRDQSLLLFFIREFGYDSMLENVNATSLCSVEEKIQPGMSGLNSAVIISASMIDMDLIHDEWRSFCLSREHSGVMFMFDVYASICGGDVSNLGVGKLIKIRSKGKL
jgi:hypothetical protein